MPPMALVDGRAEGFARSKAGRGSISASRSERPRRSSPCTPRCSPGSSFGTGNVTFALSLPPAVLESLKGLEGASEETIAEAARSASPSSNTVAVHLVEVSGAAGGVRARVTQPHREWGLGGGIVSTASPAAAAVRLLERGRITDAARFRPSSASTRTRCSRSSRPARRASR